MIVFYFLITQMPLDQDPTWGKFLGVATAIKFVGLICVFYAMLHIVSRRSPPNYLGTLQGRFFLLFLLLNSASYWFMGPVFSLRSNPFISLISMGFLLFVVLGIVDTLPRLRWTLLAAVASMGWASLIVAREWQKDPMWRPGSIAGDANYFALDACFILPLAFIFVWRSRVHWERVFAFCCLAATIGSTILGGSRGGFIATGIAFAWLLWHSPHRLRNFFIILILATPPLLVAPKSPLRRFIHPDFSDRTGQKDRIIAWKAGLRMVEHRPLTGIGLGEFKPQMDRYADPGTNFSSIAHNTYLEVAAETGLPNLLVFIAMLFFTYRSLSYVRSRASRSGPPLLYLAATGMQAGFVGYLVGAVFLSSEYMKLFWLWIFLSMALPSFLQPQAVEEREKNEIARTLTESVPQNVQTFSDMNDFPGEPSRGYDASN
jgi:O-antigen ligase